MRNEFGPSTVGQAQAAAKKNQTPASESGARRGCRKGLGKAKTKRFTMRPGDWTPGLEFVGARSFLLGGDPPKV